MGIYLAFVAKKQQGMQAEVRGSCVYLKVVSCGIRLTEGDAFSGVVRTDAATARR